MPLIKVSSKVEEQVWEDLKTLAQESHQNVSGILNEAIGEYITRRRLRPQVLDQLEQSMAENEELGELLAQ